MPKLHISINEYKDRINRLREEMVKRELDAFLVTNGVSIFYLSAYDDYELVTYYPRDLESLTIL